MLQRLFTLTALIATTVAASKTLNVHVRIHNGAKSLTKDAATTTTNDTSGYHMEPVVSIQARVQSDAPVWDKDTETWVSKFGANYTEKYRAVLDTANTASVEGALMYVQAEGINVKEQSVKCQRKNNMQYVAFYEITVVQPNPSIGYYGAKHTTPEYCPFVAMDGGACTKSGTDIPDTCKQFDGIKGQPNLGHCVGANEQTTDPRAPYPGNYWFSYPNSCVTEGRANKTDECRAKYPGGVCPPGVKPDGVQCTYGYKILGYLNIDDLVGITNGKWKDDGKGTKYKNYTEFCNANNIEFSATNTGSGFEVEQSIPFWANPGNSSANEARTAAMIKLYNDEADDADVGEMSELPEVKDLVKKNPPCYKNSPTCAGSKYGCRRILYSQICQICEKEADDCVAAPSGFKFPTLAVPKAESDNSSNSSLNADGTPSAPSPSSASSVMMSIGAVIVATLSVMTL